jgi:pimeloyl-ACP methyl ester carboxylesterase
MDVSPGRVSVNGAELAYIEQGEGDLIAFVHGSLNDLRSWDGQRAALADGYRAVACSRRYHWPNAAPCAGDLYAIATHTADLAALIEALGPGPAHLVGSSYGAMTVLTLAAARPELARTLVLGEPPLLPWLTTTPDGTALFEAFMAEAWEPAGEAQKRGDTDAMVRLFVDGVIGPGTFEHLPPPARSSMLDNAPELALELQTPPETYFPRLTPDDLRRLRVPALLLTGERSPHMFHRIQDQLASQLPDIERATIPDASHTMHLANPGAYTEMVRDFLARH